MKVNVDPRRNDLYPLKRSTSYYEKEFSFYFPHRVPVNIVHEGTAVFLQMITNDGKTGQSIKKKSCLQFCL